MLSRHSIGKDVVPLITYQYRAISQDGAKVRGVIQAVDEYTAVEKIKVTNPIVLKITPVKEKAGLLSTEIGHKKIDVKALSVMCSQFAIILRSGVSIAKCIELIADQTQNKILKKMLEGSAVDVAEGNSVAKSFEKNCDNLPVTFTETIKAGEESGTLEQSFATLEKYYDKSYKTTQKVKRALSYPIFVIVVAAIVMVVVMVKVIPTISESFSSLGGEMPWLTRALISVSEFLQSNILIIIGVIIAMIIGFKFYIASENGKIKWHTFKLKIPILGNIALLNGASQFANTMATLLTAGLSVHKSLEITSKILDNYVLSVETNRMTGSLEEGQRLGTCMRKCDHFPNTLTEMCAIGEETGELEETLETVGAYFDSEAENATAKAVSKLEPTILVFLAIFAGLIVIAIYLPMFTIYDQI